MKKQLECLCGKFEYNTNDSGQGIKCSKCKVTWMKPNIFYSDHYVYNEKCYTPEEWQRVLKLKAFL